MIASNLPSTPGEEYVTKWATFDPDQANALLDSIGLEAKDDEGWRLRPDGSGDRLRIELAAPANIGWEWDGMLEMIKDHWTANRHLGRPQDPGTQPVRDRITRQ